MCGPHFQMVRCGDNGRGAGWGRAAMRLLPFCVWWTGRLRAAAGRRPLRAAPFWRQDSPSYPNPRLNHCRSKQPANGDNLNEDGDRE